jgi:hypothetical protein
MSRMQVVTFYSKTASQLVMTAFDCMQCWSGYSIDAFICAMILTLQQPTLQHATWQSTHVTDISEKHTTCCL